MYHDSSDERPRWFWPLIAFVIGLLVGWLVIGWGVWPVTWKNALPMDLRPAERDQYLMMTAESFATNGDVDLARSRLALWPDEQLAGDLARLQDRLASEDTLQAGQVQLLASTLGVSEGTEPATAPVPPPATQPTPGLSAALQKVCPGALFVLLVLLGIAAIIWLWRRWRTSHEPQPAAAEPVGLRKGRESPEADQLPLTPSREPEATWVPFEEPAAIEAEVRQPPEPPPASGKVEPAVVAAAAAAGTTRRAPTTTVTKGEPAKVGDFTAVYQIGEPDYDEAFDISDPKTGHAGQCGLALTDPIGRNHDQAAALQLWLWDTKDPNTKVTVLMSEGAYRDTALRDQLAGEHTAIPVRLGSEFELESYNLLLRGTVDRLEYAPAEPAYGVFAELDVHMQVYRKA